MEHIAPSERCAISRRLKRRWRRRLRRRERSRWRLKRARVSRL
jgi:hypothetical protein